MDVVKKNKWFIAIKEKGNLRDFSFSDFRIIEPEKDTYHADPFLFRNKIFFELYDYKKGVIACMDKDGKNIQKVLEESHHLSFPFIIEDNKEVYMVPESGSAGRMDLYRCVEFPLKWEFVKTMMNGVFGDTVIYKHGNDYLMFTTEGDNNLRIFVAQSLMGEWTKVYSESHLESRCAGNIFKLDNMLIRPTQGGSSYGEQLFFKEFAMPYQEKVIAQLKPDWMPNLTGTHTFNFDDTHLVIDGRTKL